MRSSWKIPFFLKKYISNKKVIKKAHRKMIILKCMIDKIYQLYTYSIKKNNISINKQMLGSHLGSFILTRKEYEYRRNKKKKKVNEYIHKYKK